MSDFYEALLPSLSAATIRSWTGNVEAFSCLGRKLRAEQTAHAQMAILQQLLRISFLTRMQSNDKHTY